MDMFYIDSTLNVHTIYMVVCMFSMEISVPHGHGHVVYRNIVMFYMGPGKWIINYD